MTFPMYMFIVDCTLRITYTLAMVAIAVGVWRIGNELWRYRTGKYS